MLAENDLSFSVKFQLCLLTFWNKLKQRQLFWICDYIIEYLVQHTTFTRRLIKQVERKYAHFPGDGDARGRRDLGKRLVSDSAFKWELEEFSPYKTGRPEGIITKMLQSILYILLPWIGDIFRASVALEYVPRSWRTANKVSFRNLERKTVVSQNHSGWLVWPPFCWKRWKILQVFLSLYL